MFPGNQPPLSMLLPTLDAYTTGQTLAARVHNQIDAAHRKGEPVQGFNCSMTYLLNHYLKGKTQLLSREPHDVFPSNIIPVTEEVISTDNVQQ
ncbi:unnamed protein product [Sphagnum tenellum]